MKSGLLLILALLLNPLYAQNSYVYVYPKPNSILVSNQTNIILRSSAVVDRGSLNSDIISVRGSVSGLHSGRLVLSDDERTIVFNPYLPFTGNENITVSVKPDVRAIDGSLHPAYTYNFTTMAQDAQVMARSGSEAPVQAGNSPAAYLPPPPITINTVNNPSPGYIFMATWDRNVPEHLYANYLFVLDNIGNIVDSIRVNGAPFDFKVQPNGRLSYGLGAYTGITPENNNLTHYVLDSNLVVVDSFQMKNGYLTDFHDFILLPNGHAMLMSYTTVVYDMSRIVPNGRTDALLVIDIFQEQDAEKNVVFEWRDIDYIPITDTDLNLYDQRINPSTLNAFDLDNDGNLLMSFRNHSDIMKIDRETGEIMWKWGGLKNQFTFINEHPENAPYYFARQHNIIRLPNGNVSLFDNGEFHSPWYSRAAEYQLDEVNKTATLVSEYRYAQGNIVAQAAGNAQPVAGGGWFVGYGILLPTTPVKRNIVEVHGDGSMAFELTLPDNVIAYRALKQPWKGLVKRVKVSHAEVLQGNTYLFNYLEKITGVSIHYLALSGDMYNSVSVTRIPYGPVRPQFFTNSPIVYPVSVLYEGAAISTHTSEIHIDLDVYPEIKQPAHTSVYMRQFPGQGYFIELPTTYDSTANELIATTTVFGEIVFGRPDVQQASVPPFLIKPLNGKKIISSAPVVMKWSGSGLVESFNLHLAKDSLFNTLVLDTTTVNSFVSKSNLTKNQKYFWRVRANGASGSGGWSQVWSFEPADAFVNLLSPNGGEVLELGDTTIVRWETNISDSAKIEIFQGDLNLGTIGKCPANFEAFRWIIPATYAANSTYRLRVRSMIDTSLSDISNAVFSLTVPSGVSENIQELTKDIKLFQNYPNPFNPGTSIKYSLRNRQFVTVKIFDVLGKEIQTLVSEIKSAGSYQVNWNAADYPSGVYFCKLQAGSFVETKKMILFR